MKKINGGKWKVERYMVIDLVESRKLNINLVLGKVKKEFDINCRVLKG